MTAATYSSAIYIEGLTKSFGHVRAVDGLTLDVPRGSIFGFLGANGAGKTTTLRMIAGLARPTAGSIEVAGHASNEGTWNWARENRRKGEAVAGRGIPDRATPAYS